MEEEKLEYAQPFAPFLHRLQLKTSKEWNRKGDGLPNLGSKVMGYPVHLLPDASLKFDVNQSQYLN